MRTRIEKNNDNNYYLSTVGQAKKEKLKGGLALLMNLNTKRLCKYDGVLTAKLYKHLEVSLTHQSPLEA